MTKANKRTNYSDVKLARLYYALNREQRAYCSELFQELVEDYLITHDTDSITISSYNRFVFGPALEATYKHYGLPLLKG